MAEELEIGDPAQTKLITMFLLKSYAITTVSATQLQTTPTTASPLQRETHRSGVDGGIAAQTEVVGGEGFEV